MTKAISGLELLALLAENQIMISHAPKVVWLNKASDKVSVVNPDLGVKLSNHGGCRVKALTEGLRLLGVVL